MNKRENILICPLNWGLGHASRCIPIITILVNNNYNVVVAASGNAYFLLKKTFPLLTVIEFNDYNIKYSKGKTLSIKIVLQLPKIFFRIMLEHQCLKKLICDYQIDIVISDNRFGLWNKKVKSVYITHQINIKYPGNNKVPEKLLYNIHKHFIKKYDVCWIPDYSSGFKLAGELSTKKKVPDNALYIGILSRFSSLENEIVRQFDLCVLLSGPEPQRSILEKIIIKQIQQSEIKAVIIQGLPAVNNYNLINDHIHLYSSLPSYEIQDFILKSEFVLARSGYSTIMDLASLGKKAILIPTPGQTEQQYLANYLSEKNIFYTVEQDNFDLIKALNCVKETKGIHQPSSHKELEKLIMESIERL